MENELLENLGRLHTTELGVIRIKKNLSLNVENVIEWCKEKIIRLWFDMWLKQQDLGIDKIFTEDVVYTESWCPKYENLKTVKHWFNEWNTRGKVIIWDIKQFFHKENQTVVEWYFKNEMNTGSVEEFDGISLIEWTEDNKIKSLKEYGCNLNNYNPYQHSDNPQFRDEKTNWF